MSDPLLPRRPLPAPLSVEPGQAERAFGQVQARRRRSAALATTVVVALVTGVAVSAGPAGRDSISVEPADKRPLVATAPAARPEVNPVTPSPGPRATTVVAASARSAPTPSVAVPSAVVAPPDPDESTRPGPAPRPGYRRRPAVRRVTQRGVVNSSEGHVGGCVGPNPWCAVVGSTSTEEALHFRFIVCRNAGDSRLSFETEAEMDVAVREYAPDGSGREIWRWSGGQTFRKLEHELAVPSGACVVWSMSWDAVLDSGRRIPPGEYELIGTSLAAETQFLRAESRFRVR